MKSSFISWLSTVLALATLTVLPNVSAISPVSILITATIIWLLLVLLWPILKIFLLPFNLASFGLIGSLVYFFLFWFCLWILPGVMVEPVRLFGFYMGDVAVLLLLSFLLSLLQRLFSWLLARILHEKRRK